MSLYPRYEVYRGYIVFAFSVLSDFINLTQVHNYTVSALDIISFRRISIDYVRFTESEQCFKRHKTQLVHCSNTVPHSRVGLVATPRA